MSETLSHWINGQAVAGQSGRMGDVFNPAIGEKIAEVPFASTGEVDLAVAAASAAAPAWAASIPELAISSGVIGRPACFFGGVTDPVSAQVRMVFSAMSFFPG